MESYAARAFLASLLLWALSAKAITLQGGDIIVADFPTKNIIRVNPDTGAQDVINAEPLPGHPLEIKMAWGFNERKILVLVDTVDALIGLDPESGTYEFLSTPNGLITSPNDFVYHLDRDRNGTNKSRVAFVTTGNNGSVIKVNLDTGLETLVASGNLINNASTISVGNYLWGEDREEIEKLLVTNNHSNSIIEIDVSSGEQNALIIGGLINNPADMDHIEFLTTSQHLIDIGSTILSNSGTNNIIKVDVRTGEQSVVFSATGDFNPTAIRRVLGDLYEINFYVGDEFNRDLYLVKTNTNEKTTITSNGYINQISGIESIILPKYDADHAPLKYDQCPNTNRRNSNIRIGSCDTNVDDEMTTTSGCSIEQLFEKCITNNNSFRAFKDCARTTNKKLLDDGENGLMFFGKFEYRLINQCLQPKNFDF